MHDLVIRNALVVDGTGDASRDADVAVMNVIDFDGLRLHAPRMAHDRPAGGRRLLQDVDGHLHTIKSGAVTFTDGQPTGARPGTVLRSR